MPDLPPARPTPDPQPAPATHARPSAVEATPTQTHPAAPDRAAPSDPTPTRAPAGARAARGRGRAVALIGLLAALVVAGWYGLDWWREGRFLISTDDAYVKADIAVIAPKVSGYVAAIVARDNQPVKTGDVLLKIDDGDYRIALEAAQQRIGVQDATIARIGAQVAAQRAGLAQSDAQIAAAVADKARADAAFARASDLARRDVASQATFDQADADRKRAAAALDGAKAAREVAAQTVVVLEAQRREAERARGELDAARDKALRDLSFTTITAPFDGVVGARAAQLGQLVQPGQRLMALAPLSAAYVEANFKETQLGGLRPGQKARLVFDAMPDRPVEGEVLSLSPATGAQFSLLPPDNATGNFTKIVQRVPVRISIPADVAALGELRPGLSVVVDVDTRTGADANGGAHVGGAPAPDAVSRARDWIAGRAPNATRPDAATLEAQGGERRPAP
jgi:membrane fusion protein (multidrug efflux system)